MELHANNETRKRITVGDGNPIILTVDNVAEYNALCVAVEEYNAASLLLDETHLEFNMSSLYVRDDKRIKIPPKKGITWVVEQLKTRREEITYEEQSVENGRFTFTLKRGKGLLEALNYALNLPDCKLEIDEKKYVKVGTSDARYNFSLFDLPLKLRKDADALIGVFKLKQLAKLHGIKV